MRARHGTRGAAFVGLVGLIGLATAAATGGCERLNPDWCTEHAACGVNEFCDPATNTCLVRDAGQPDLDLAISDQAVDRPGDLAVDHPVDAPADGPGQETAPPLDLAPETTPAEAGGG